MAQNAVLSKVLCYDLIRLAKKIAASLDNDTAGCYDKIVPPPRKCMLQANWTSKIGSKNASGSFEQHSILFENMT